MEGNGGSRAGDLAPGPGPQDWQNIPTPGFPLPSASQGMSLPNLSQLAKKLLNWEVLLGEQGQGEEAEMPFSSLILQSIAFFSPLLGHFGPFLYVGMRGRPE